VYVNGALLRGGFRGERGGGRSLPLCEQSIFKAWK